MMINKLQGVWYCQEMSNGSLYWARDTSLKAAINKVVALIMESKNEQE